MMIHTAGLIGWARVADEQSGVADADTFGCRHPDTISINAILLINQLIKRFQQLSFFLSRHGILLLSVIL